MALLAIPLLVTVYIKMNEEEIKNWLSLKLLKKRDKNFSIENSRNEELFADFKFKKKITKEDNLWIEKEIELIKKHNAQVISIHSDSYPESLRNIHNPPILLYVQGSLPSFKLPHVAVVGTRLASHYGLKMSETIARDLSLSGVVIVSGGARGCDSYAHKGALDGGGLTVAVLGTGLDVVYPKENEKLYENIKNSGALVTEFPFGTAPLPYNFPARNRIISGLSRGIVVAEAPLKSGAMMTARMGLDEGRDVFAVPGKSTSDKSSGTNKLIKDGAMLVDSAEDILSNYNIEIIKNADNKESSDKKLNSEESKIVEILSDEPIHIDKLMKLSQITIQKLSYILLDMELRGLIKQQAGKHYVKA